MPDVKSLEVVQYLNDLLRTDALPDSQNALNGLQVQNSGTFTRLAVSVDSSERVINAAADAGCNMLIVHHGMLWDGNLPVTAARYRKLARLISSDIALYSVHVPLDVHPVLGNNAILAREIGIDVKGTFGKYKGIDLGFWGELEIRRESLAARLDELLGVRVRLIPGGSEMIRTIGVVSGSAANLMGEAKEIGLDAFITGEGNHHTYAEAEETGINLYYGGHYATETWGVKALGAHLGEKFGIPWQFIDFPTGL